MTVEPSTFEHSGRPFRRLGTQFAILAAMVLAGFDVLSTAVLTTSASPSTTGNSSLLLSAVVPVLVVGGLVAAWRSRHRELWLVTGCLLLVGMAPFGVRVEFVLVALFVCFGAVDSGLPKSGYESLFGAGLFLSVVGVGAELYTQVTGYVSVMVVVGSALLFGGAVAVLGANGTAQLRRLSNWPSRERLQTTLVSGAATDRTWYPVWMLLLGWSIGVCTLHFSGLMYSLYTRFWWWDLLTHTSSGAGVAAWVYLLRPAAFRPHRPLFVLLPAVVFLSGAGFEVYEFLFRGFYEVWSVEYYLQDTVEDMICNLGGAVVLSLLVYFSK